MKVLSVLCLVAGIALAAVCSAEANPADTIYLGGDILTMNGESATYAEAVAVRDGRIIFVGSKAEAMQMQGDTTKIRDLGGKAMLPGFVDPHGHFMSAVQMVNQVNVASPPVGTSTDISGIIEKLKAYQQDHEVPAGEWIVGWGYDQDLLEEGRHITKRDLDPHFPDHKVMIIHVSMHGAVLNSKALEWAGIDADTPTPAGGVIARLDESDEPAGLLMEMAYIPVFGKMPQPSEEEMLALMDRAQMMYASEGYTQAVEGFTHIKDLDFLRQAADENKIFLDIVALPGFVEMEEWIGNPKYEFGKYHNGFKIQAGKITLDGSPQGRTAFVSKPYLTGGPDGEGNWRGEPSISQEQLDSLIQQLFDHDIPIQIHTNGDAAIDMMIAAVEKTGITAKDDRRTVIVHSQFQRPDHLPKYVELGLTPSYFTNHTYFWGDVHIKNIGKEAAFFISPVRSAKEAGLVFANHTDFNVTPLDPFFVIWTAMKRESRSGQIIGQDEQVDAYTALQGLTTGPAWQFFEEDRKGMIKAGLLADFVILSADPVKTGVDEMRDIEVLETIKEDQTIFRADQSAP